MGVAYLSLALDVIRALFRPPACLQRSAGDLQWTVADVHERDTQVHWETQQGETISSSELLESIYILYTYI